MLFDIPINIKVNANTEQEAELYVTSAMEKIMDKEVGLLNRTILEWDFIVFVEDELEFVEGDEDEDK